MEPFSVLPLRLFRPPGDDAIPSFPATPLPQMALATCRRRHVVRERCCGHSWGRRQGGSHAGFDPHGAAASRLAAARRDPWRAEAGGDGRRASMRGSQPTGIRGGLARGQQDGTRGAHVPPRNNRRDDIAEARSRAARDARGRGSGPHEEDAIGRTDRKY